MRHKNVEKGGDLFNFVLGVNPGTNVAPHLFQITAVNWAYSHGEQTNDFLSMAIRTLKNRIYMCQLLNVFRSLNRVVDVIKTHIQLHILQQSSHLHLLDSSKLA